MFFVFFDQPLILFNARSDSTWSAPYRLSFKPETTCFRWPRFI